MTASSNTISSSENGSNQRKFQSSTSKHLGTTRLWFFGAISWNCCRCCFSPGNDGITTISDVGNRSAIVMQARSAIQTSYIVSLLALLRWSAIPPAFRTGCFAHDCREWAAWLPAPSTADSPNCAP